MGPINRGYRDTSLFLLHPYIFSNLQSQDWKHIRRKCLPLRESDRRGIC